MQIKPQTARGLGYEGGAAGLKQPETNIRYGMKYLGEAYRMAQRRYLRHGHALPERPLRDTAQRRQPDLLLQGPQHHGGQKVAAN